MRIAIITTVANFELYDKTNYLFDSKFDRYVIDGRDGMHGIHSILYMMKKFKKLDYNYLIMADEDFILKSNDAIYSLIDEMKQNNIVISGVRDGGVISHRNYNPFCVNTFFSILDLKRIKQIWNKKEMLSHQKIYSGEFCLEEDLKNEYNEISLYEPYYCFYLWLLRKGEKIKYLDSKSLNTKDTITNVVYNKEELIGYHSWYARSYRISTKHTKRIDELFNLVNIKANQEVGYVLWKDKKFKYIQCIYKFFRKIKLKFQ